ncbi:YibE/F family protein [Desulfosporosinus fructosivorans]|uniref:YibE/F family protein n=1 Tax=Desulfosporosinus fructosivorans TaxID=2018669 RepID=A0A4Z0R705_9FIRM|nr:YibE/F family protein [Desulfosporosinus fructosivorans]TGE38165.1 YibE/F family protein [Desulfosporosinus fructosivorans]
MQKILLEMLEKKAAYLKKIPLRELIFNLIVITFVVFLALMPTGFQENTYSDSMRAVAKVLEVNNDNLLKTASFVFEGEQVCKVEILDGPFKGQQTLAHNRFMGRMEMDKSFTQGDKALVVIDYTDKNIRNVTMIDHYRINLESILIGIFAIFLILFARWTGAKALLSFLMTVLMIWKLLVPLLLKGWNPIIISLYFVVTATSIIIFLVGGLNRQSIAAVLGSLSGTLLTTILAIISGHSFKIHGAVLPYSESLLYAGYAHLDLTQILIAVVFIASAGAVMDLAMDIAAAVHEVVESKPDITTAEAILSGLNVGRKVVGTMTTTLLFAYTGGYISLLMYFMAQGTPVVDILNLKYVSMEIMHTIVGSFGLVAVAPFTALASGILLTKRAV